MTEFLSLALLVPMAVLSLAAPGAVAATLSSGPLEALSRRLGLEHFGEIFALWSGVYLGWTLVLAVPLHVGPLHQSGMGLVEFTLRLAFVYSPIALPILLLATRATQTAMPCWAERSRPAGF